MPKTLSENSLQADGGGGGAEQVILIHQRADPRLGGPPAVTACAIMQRDTCTIRFVHMHIYVPLPRDLGFAAATRSHAGNEGTRLTD